MRNPTFVDNIPEEARTQTNGYKGGVIWMTGLSAAGKSTLASALAGELFARGYQVVVLDGDNLRHGLCNDLGFSPRDRAENIRRVGAVAHLFAEAGIVAVSALISPYRADRDKVRAMGPHRFHEIHIATSLSECERRDPKGLYRKARAGEIADFTGISAPYEPPEAPEMVVRTEGMSPAQCVARLVAYVAGTLGAPAPAGDRAFL